MWEQISEHFSRVPSQAEVAKYLLETGIRVDGTKLFVDKVAISHSKVAEGLGKDKRIVTATVKTIASIPHLTAIYSKIRPTCNLIDVAGEMGWDVIEVTLSDPAMPSVLGKIANLIGETGVSIRQAIGEDPTYSTGSLFVITESSLPGSTLKKIRSIDGVERVTIH